MKGRRQDARKHQHCKIRRKSGEDIADGEYPPSCQHQRLAIHPRAQERHGRPGGSHHQSKAADQPAGTGNAHVKTLGDHRQDAYDPHLCIEDAKDAQRQDQDQTSALLSHAADPPLPHRLRR